MLSAAGVRNFCNFGLLVVMLFLALFAIVPVEQAGAYDQRTMKLVNDPAIKKLISADLRREAMQEVDRLLKELRTKGDDEEVTRYLVLGTLLRIDLNEQENAVRFLKEQPWPVSAQSKTILQLFYAETLLNYIRQYDSEIARREKIAINGSMDLKNLTKEELIKEVERAYQAAWEDRERLGEQPVDALDDYITYRPCLNCYDWPYPPGVRSNPRDTLTYLYFGFLSDTNNWRPEQSNKTYQLDLPGLLNTIPPALKADAHPLEKIVNLLADLEAWHTGKGELEAALKARLERIRSLNSSFYAKEDRARIIVSLFQILPAYRSVPRWATGMAELAKLSKQEEKPDALVRVRDVAKECFDAYPESPGGKDCKQILQDIEEPEYQLLAMQTDGPQKRSIEVTHKNVSDLYFRAYSVDILSHIKTRRQDLLHPTQEEMDKLLSTSLPDASWHVELPATQDFRFHRTFVTPPHIQSGLYLIAASIKKDFSDLNKDKNFRGMLSFIVTNLVIVSTCQDGQVMVLSGDQGEPVKDAELQIFKFGGSGYYQVATARTDAAGLVRLNILQACDSILLASKNGDSTLQYGRTTYYPPHNRLNHLIYTERSVYRPNQRIFWKVVAYDPVAGEPNNFKVRPSSTVTVSLRDPNSQVVETKTVSTNEYGSAAGEFTIPLGRLLGRWQIDSRSEGNPDSGYTSVQVEEYKRPTFEASINEPGNSLRLNRPATLTGEVKYYFGQPVSNGKVKWQVMRQAVYPSWQRYGGEIDGSVEQAQNVASGISSLNEDGKFSLTFTPEADERKAGNKKANTYNYTITADITDEGGETRTATRSFRLGFVAVEAQVDFAHGILMEGKEAVVNVARTDLNNAPQAGQGTWRLTSLRQPKNPLLPAEEPLSSDEQAESNKTAIKTPGDLLHPRWWSGYPPEQSMKAWQDDKELAKGLLDHDTKGQARLTLPGLSPGAYRLHYETADNFGAVCQIDKEFIVAGEKLPLALPAVLLTDSDSVPVGGTARLLVYSGLPGQQIHLAFYHNGSLFERRSLRMDKDRNIIELPIIEKYRGNIKVRLLTLRDHQLMTLERNFIVPWDNKELEIGFSSFRDRIKPGDEERWTITVKGKDDKTSPVTAELLAYMYDKSLDLFVPHTPPRPLNLYPTIALPISLTSSLTTTFPSLNYGEGKMRGPMFAPMHEMTPTVEIRSDFSETAFWRPQLLTGQDGSAQISFTVPDSLTTWNVWVHALTKDMRSGSLKKEVKTVKELMVRPYLPRFLREGDQAAVKVVVNNASEAELSGTVVLDIIDPATGTSLLSDFGLTKAQASQAFKAAKDGSANLTFPLTTPARVGEVAFRVEAKAGNLSDGELRPLPILPSRMHLFQSRFTTLKGKIKRSLRFAEMAAKTDPSRINEQLVVTIDAQLFYSVLSALPYLVNYPYECNEQAVNRFISTGILTSFYKDFPAMAEMAKKFAKRETRLATWNQADPNRKMALEETPWLVDSKGGKESWGELENILDPRIAQANRDSALDKLKKAQFANGGWSWFPGDKYPSPHMTLYILQSFAKGLEFGVEAPKAEIAKAWSYLHQHYLDKKVQEMMNNGTGWEFITHLNYVLSSYPDAASWTGGVFTAEEQKKMLDFSFQHWQQHSPMLKCYLALTLKRMQREADATMVFASVMDRAKSSENEGTYWAAEDRAWLWYNDTIETHAFALRTLMELTPSDERRDGLVLWLFLNKKMNQWKSTRATAEVIYSLAHYLRKEGSLGIREDAKVTIGKQQTSFVFEPDTYTGGHNQVVIPGEKINPATDSEVVVEKEAKSLAFASATWHFSTEKLPTEASGDFLAVTRQYFRRETKGKDKVLTPLAEGEKLEPGDQVEVKLSVRAKHPCEYIHLKDPRAAGLEPENVVSGHRGNLGIRWYEETRDSSTNFFFEHLPQGEYTFNYRLRANMAGTFRVGPATLQSMYAPEFTAYSAGEMVTVTAGE